MRKAGWKRITGILFAAALLSGCAKQTYVEVTIAEETTVAATSAEIHIETATTEAEKVDPDQPPYYLPEERVEENGLIRSYLTGEMTDAAKANRRPIAVMMSNDKQALPQYGINRAGVVYEMCIRDSLYDALYQIMGAESYLHNSEKGLIEVAPLAYMRGRTLDNAYIILDEAQNTTPAQMKMFLTLSLIHIYWGV